MPWFYVDDEFAFSRKAVAAGNAAIGLWTRAGSWSRKEGTHGFIPIDMARALGTPAQAAKLVAVPAESKAGLWVKTTGGFQFHEWDDRYDTERERQIRERRSAAGRLGGIKSGATRKTGSKNEAFASAKPEANASANASANPKQNPKQNRTHVLVPDGGSVGELSYESYARDIETPPTKSAEPPQNRCSEHLHHPNPPKCGACGDARRRRETWDREQARIAAEQRSSEARKSAEIRARSIADCALCDGDGYANGRPCDHDPTAAERNRNGIAAVRAALAAKGNPDA